MVVKASRSPAERLDVLNILRKYILCCILWAFLTSAVAFTDHLRFLLMWIPRYLFPWCWSKVGGREDLMCAKTSCSKHFEIMGVNATGL